MLIDNHDEVNFSQESLTAAQIIVSNARKRTKMKKDQKLVRWHIRKMSGDTVTYLQQFLLVAQGI